MSNDNNPYTPTNLLNLLAEFRNIGYAYAGEFNNTPHMYTDRIETKVRQVLVEKGLLEFDDDDIQKIIVCFNRGVNEYSQQLQLIPVDENPHNDEEIIPDPNAIYMSNIPVVMRDGNTSKYYIGYGIDEPLLETLYLTTFINANRVSTFIVLLGVGGYDDDLLKTVTYEKPDNASAYINIYRVIEAIVQEYRARGMDSRADELEVTGVRGISSNWVETYPYPLETMSAGKSLLTE